MNRRSFLKLAATAALAVAAVPFEFKQQERLPRRLTQADLDRAYHALIAEADRLSYDIYLHAVRRSPWLELIDASEFPAI